MLDWPVDSCVFLSLVFLSPRFKSKLKGKHHISSSIIELTNVRFCGLIVGPCVAFLKLVMVGVVAPSTGWAEEVHNADEVSLLCSLIRDVGPLCWSCHLWLFIGSIILIFRCNTTDALFKKLFRFADLWRRTIESYYSPPDAGVGVWDVGFFLVLFSRFLVLKMCSRARVWAIRAELYPTQVQRHITAFWRLWNITGSNDPWHFSIQFCSLIQSWGLQKMP